VAVTGGFAVNELHITVLTLAALGRDGQRQEAARAAARLSDLVDGGRGYGDHGAHRHSAGTGEFHLQQRQERYGCEQD